MTFSRLADVAAAVMCVCASAAAAQLAGLPEVPVEEFVLSRGDPRMVVVDLRGAEATAAAAVQGAVRPEAVGQEDLGAECVAVLVIDAEVAAVDVAAAASRLWGAGCALRRLGGGAADWISAGIARPAGHRRPGEVPFVVPRGLCEHGEPVQEFK